MSIKNKAKIYGVIKNVGLVLLGCFILAIADALFIMPAQIVNGGIDSVGVILNHFFSDKLGFDISDITIAVLQLILWVIGLIFLGKKFSFYTLLGTLAFPAFYSILLRARLIDLVGISEFYARHGGLDNLEFSVVIVAGLFGGLLSGIGVALTYLGDGSTGGSDIITFLIAKYTSIKQDLGGLIIDTSMIVIGLACLQSWELFLSGIISAAIAALAIRVIYVQSDNPVIMDIICAKPEPVMDFIHVKLDHATSLFEIEGGYSGEKKVVVRSVVYGTEAKDVRAFVANIDPDAFITTFEASNISGEGFEPLSFSPRSVRRILHRYGIKTKEEIKKAKELEKEKAKKVLQKANESNGDRMNSATTNAPTQQAPSDVKQIPEKKEENK